MFDKKFIYSFFLLFIYTTSIFIVIYDYNFPISYENKMYVIDNFHHQTCEMKIFIPCETICEHSIYSCSTNFYIFGPYNECCTVKDKLIIGDYYYYCIFVIFSFIKTSLYYLLIFSIPVMIYMNL
jgi:hypothetical protein